jgi:aquaporin related protein
VSPGYTYIHLTNLQLPRLPLYKLNITPRRIVVSRTTPSSPSLSGPHGHINSYMAQPQSGSLPQYYGQTMPDGTLVGSPKASLGSPDSRDALLRLPIQPHAAHVGHPDQQVMSPVTAVPNSPNTMGMGSPPIGGSKSRARPMGESSQWIVPHVSDREREEEYYSRGPRPGRPSMSHRTAYVEDYSDEEDGPRAYRRPARRHNRPPPAHGHRSRRYSTEQGGRSSMDSYDYGYDSDTPTKPRVHPSYAYGSEGEEEGMYRGPRPAYGGGGRRGPPSNKPPSTVEVMRLPWTMWMNSNAKNRRSYPSLRSVPDHLSSALIPVRKASSSLTKRASLIAMSLRSSTNAY